MTLHRFLGLIVAPAYALRRGRIGFLRLDIGALLFCLLAAGYVIYRAWRNGFALSYAAPITFCMLLMGLLLWAGVQRYVVFQPKPASDVEVASDLAAEQKLILRGSGSFEVNNMRRYLVEVPVVFWSTQLGEHILAAKVRAFNILGVGVPSNERGWWYIFLEPSRVIEIAPGELYFGFRRRPAVRLLYRTDEGREVICLSSDRPEQRAILLKDLQAKIETWRNKRGPSDPGGDG